MNKISKMNHSVTGDDSPLVFIQNKKNKREVKSRLSIAERINSMPDSRFKVCGGVKKNKKLLNSPLPDNSRILNDNDNIQVIEAKNNKIPQVNKNYKYIFQDRINTKKISNKYNKDKSTFRTHWAYPNKPKARKGKAMKQFKKVGCNEIIIDIGV